MNLKPLILSLAAVALLAGCSVTPNTAGLGGGDYSRAQARGAQNVEFGIVEAVRQVRVDASNPNPGMRGAVAPAVGAIAGGALGSTIGKGDGRKVAIALGAIAGGAAGAAVQQAGSEIPGVEITVRLNTRIVAITQADEGLTFRVGDRVRVMSDGRTWRVAPM